MQDLESLRSIALECDIRGSLVVELIDRLQAAEKDRDDWKLHAERQAADATARMIQAMENGAAANALRDELNALREQKPVGTARVYERMSGIGPVNVVAIDPNLSAGLIDGQNVYASPVAQSRDSAEPAITDHEGRPLQYWGGKANSNDHIKAAAEAKQAVPDGYRALPIEPTSAMLDAGVAMALQVSVHGQGGWSKYIAALWAQLLSAAPQPEEKMWWREIAETSWAQTTDKAWFECCQKSPEHDTWLERKGESQPEGAAPELFQIFEAGWNLKTQVDGHCFDGRDVCRITACDFWPESLKNLHQDAGLDFGIDKHEAIVRLKNAVRRRLSIQQSPAPKAQDNKLFNETVETLRSIVSSLKLVENDPGFSDRSWEIRVGEAMLAKISNPGRKDDDHPKWLSNEMIKALASEITLFHHVEERHPEIKPRLCACMGPQPICRCANQNRLVAYFLRRASIIKDEIAEGGKS